MFRDNILLLNISLLLLILNVIYVNCGNGGCETNKYNRAEGLCETLDSAKRITRDNLWRIITFLPYVDREQLCYNQLINVALTASQVQLININYANLKDLNNNCFRGLNSLLTINLSNNKLSAIDSGNFIHMKNSLVNITLSFNQIYKYDNQFDDFVYRSLKVLNLKSNRLRSIVIKRNNYPSISVLNLSENELSLVVIESNSLKKLDLSDTLITDLSTKSSNILITPFLEELNLKNCLLKSFHGDLFEGMQNLKQLNVAGNPIVKIFPFDLDSLKVINLQKTEVRDFSALGELSALASIDLSDNYIYELDMEFSATLVSLICSQCRLHKVKTHSLVTYYQKLLALDLSWNYLEDADFFQSTYIELSPLITINLSHNRIRLLQRKVFEKLSLLEDLHLSHNLIEIIHNDAFVGMNNLKSMDLSSNRIFQINQAVFLPLINLEILKINANKLSYFPAPTSQPPQVFRKLRLFIFYGNPMQCSCENEIYQWTTNNNILVHISDLRKDGKKPLCIVTGDQCDPNMSTNIINDVSYNCAYLWSD